MFFHIILIPTLLRLVSDIAALRRQVTTTSSHTRFSKQA